MKALKITTEFNIYLRTKESNSPIYENGQELNWKDGNVKYFDGIKDVEAEIEEVEINPVQADMEVMTFTGSDNGSYSVFVKNGEIIIPSAFKKQIESAKKGNYVITCTSFYCDICNSVFRKHLDNWEMTTITKEELDNWVGIKDEKKMSMQEFANETVSYVRMPVFFLQNGIYHETFAK